MSRTKKLTSSGICLALCLLLPFLTGQIPQIGSMLCPMHIPVLLCGLIAGAPWGAAVGCIAPLLRYVLFGMPPIFPTGLSMAVELAVYGLVTGLVYAKAPKTLGGIYLSLGVAMVAGRVAWGLMRYVLAVATGVEFTVAMFVSGAFLTAWPGIILHLVLIPPIVRALERSKLAFA